MIPHNTLWEKGENEDRITKDIKYGLELDNRKRWDYENENYTEAYTKNEWGWDTIRRVQQSHMMRVQFYIIKFKVPGPYQHREIKPSKKRREKRRGDQSQTYFK